MKPLNLAIALTSAFNLSLTALPALAHGDAHAPHPAGEHAHRAPHGGQVRTVGDYHYEFVVQPERLIVYLLDDGMKPLSPAGKRGRAIVQVPGKGKQDVQLSPVGDRFVGKAAMRGVTSFVAVVSLEVDGKHRSARFTSGK